MICLSNKGDVSNLLKNRKQLVRFQGEPTQHDIVSGLDFVHESISEEKTPDGKYQTHDKGHVITKRVTDPIKRKWEAGRSIAEIEENEKNNKKYSEAGTFIHNMAELVGQSLNNGSYSKDRKAIMDKALKGDGVRNLTLPMFESLEKGVKEVFDEIQSVQQSIDPNGKAVLRFEQRVLDPRKDVGGTIDILVIYSDGSADIIDFKTTRDKLGTNLFSKSKINDFKLQLSTYKQILVQQYGVKKIRRGRVVPIIVSFEDKNFKQLLMGKAAGSKLEQVMVLPETTGVKSIDKFIQDLTVQLDKKGDPEVEQLLNRLVVGQELKPMVDHITHIAKEVLNHYNETGNLDGKYDLLHEISIGASFVEDLSGELSKLSRFPEIKKQVTDYAQKINELRDVYSQLKEIRASVLIDHAYRASNQKAPESPDDLVLTKDTVWTKWFGRVTDFTNPFFKYLRKVLDDIQFETRNGLRKDEDRIATAHTNVEKWMKENGKEWKDVVDMLFNRETENFYSEMSPEFYVERNKAAKNSDYKWILSRYKKKDGYDAEYNERLAAKVAELEAKFENKKTRFDYLEKWKSDKDLSLDANGNPVYPKAWTSWRNTELKEEYREQYRSEQFKQIRAIQPIYEYYTTVLDLNKQYREMLGLKYGSLPDNFVPFIRKDMIEKLQTVGVSGAWEEMRTTFEIREDETAYGQINDLTGKFDRSVPMFYVNPFRNDDGTLRKGEKSTDFTKSVLLFSKMAHNYKQASKYEANILAMRDILATAKYVQTDTKGRWVYNQFGDVKATLNPEPVKIFDTFVDYYFYGKTIQEQGVTTKILGQEVNSTQLIRKAKQYFSLKSLGLAVVPAAASYISAGTQAWMEGKEGIVYTSEQWKNATKRMATDFNRYHMLFKFFDVSNDDLMSKVSINKKGSVIGNNLYQDKLRKYVSSRALMSPYRLGDEHLDAHIANAMAENYVVNKEGIVRRKAMVSGEEWKSILDVFKVDEDGNVTIDHVAPGKDGENTKKFIIKFRKAVRDAQRGIKGTMTDEDIMFAQTHLFTNLLTQFRTWMPGVLNKRFGKLTYNENTDALKFGKYSAFASELNVSGATSLVHYFTEGIIPTLGQLTKDLALGTISFGLVDQFKYNVEGRYKNNAAYRKQVDVWFDKWKEKNRDEYNKLIELYGSEEKLIEDFLNVKQRAVRNTVNELRVAILIFATIMLLKSDMDDDDEPLWKEFWLTHKALQVASRTLTELTFAFDVTSLQALMRGSAVPLTGLFIDATNVIKEVFESAYETPLGIEDTKTEKELEDRLLKLFPAITQLIKTFDLTEAEAGQTK